MAHAPGEAVTSAGKSRQLAVILSAGLVGLALSGTLVWQVMGAQAGQPVVNRSADEVRLAEVSAQQKIRATTQAGKLRQQDVGQGVRFDTEGNLIEEAAPSSDLPQNKALDEAMAGPPRAEIAQGIRLQRRPTSRAESQSDTQDDPRDDQILEGESHRSRPAGGDEGANRAELTQPMLGYSTVRAAKWAMRRPDDDHPDSSGAKSGARKAPIEPDQEGPTGAAPAAETGAAIPAGIGMGGGAPQVSPGPSGRGNALYGIGEGGAPAEQSPQMFAAGSIGDMRIGGGIGPENIVRQGKFLDCVVVNRIQADLVESPVIAMVSRDFVTLDGKYVLVPAGSKLLGSAGSVQNLQQARVYIKFDRVIFPDQRTAYFPIRKIPAVDGTGAVGIEGDVDRHFMLQFGSAVMLGMLDGFAAVIQGPGTGNNPTVRELVTARTSSNLSQVVMGVIQKYANVVPTVTVDEGSKLKVFFSEDVKMSPYLRTSELLWMGAAR